MDNKRNNQISIVFNGKEKKLEIDENEDKVESEEKHEEEEFPWILPDEKEKSNVIDFEEKRKKQKKESFRRPSHKKGFRRPLFKFRLPTGWLALVSAVVIGTCFGFVLLSFFTDINFIQSPGVSQPVVTAPVENEVSTEETTATATKVASVIPSLTMHVIQAGAFTTVESAESIITTLKNSGFPTVMYSEEESYLLFVGIGQNKETLQQVGESFDQEIYVKPITIEGTSVEFDNKQMEDFVIKTRDLYERLASLSSKALAGTSISQAEWDEVKNMKAAIEQLKPEQLDKPLQQLSTELTTAVDSIQNVNTPSLWKVQQSLLNGLPAYEEWMTTLKNK